MVFGKIVEVERMDTDRYGRTVALVAADKELLNKQDVIVCIKGDANFQQMSADSHVSVSLGCKHFRELL